MTNYPMSDDERALVAQIERFSTEVLAPKRSIWTQWRTWA